MHLLLSLKKQNPDPSKIEVLGRVKKEFTIVIFFGAPWGSGTS